MDYSGKCWERNVDFNLIRMLGVSIFPVPCSLSNDELILLMYYYDVCDELCG